MKKVSSMPKFLLTVLLVSIALLFSGCAFKTGPVAEDKRIVLKEKTDGQETFTDGALNVYYEYEQKGGNMTISGSISFRRSLDSLDIRVFFLDGAGVVIDRKLVYSSGYRSLAARDSNRTFRRTIEVAPGAKYFTFDEISRERTSLR